MLKTLRTLQETLSETLSGLQLYDAAKRGDRKVRTLLSTQDAQSFMNFQDKDGDTLQIGSGSGHAAVTEVLLAARCNVDLQTENGFTWPTTPKDAS
jgi:hypothetical protein